MFYVLVKFKGNPHPELYGTTHISHASRLATMDGVEWASPTISNGNALVYETELGGKEWPSAPFGNKITAYQVVVPEP